MYTFSIINEASSQASEGGATKEDLERMLAATFGQGVSVEEV